MFLSRPSTYRIHMKAAQVAYWEQAVAKSVDHPQWRQYLQANAWEWGYRNSKDPLAYIKQG